VQYSGNIIPILSGFKAKVLQKKSGLFLHFFELCFFGLIDIIALKKIFLGFHPSVAIKYDLKWFEARYWILVSGYWKFREITISFIQDQASSIQDQSDSAATDALK
jgi:hypothetical protein